MKGLRGRNLQEERSRGMKGAQSGRVWEMKPRRGLLKGRGRRGREKGREEGRDGEQNLGRKLRNQKTFYTTQAFSFMGKDVQCSVC